jgi:hypothetical protein
VTVAEGDRLKGAIEMLQRPVRRIFGDSVIGPESAVTTPQKPFGRECFPTSATGFRPK